MNDFERKEKLAEIFGQSAEYFEEWFSPDDFDERDVAIAKKIGKPLSEIEFGDFLDYLDKDRPEIAKELHRCMRIALDARKHGRFWTTDNPLKTLISRKDMSIFEEFTMYVMLRECLGLEKSL